MVIVYETGNGNSQRWYKQTGSIWNSNKIVPNIGKHLLICIIYRKLCMLLEFYWKGFDRIDWIIQQTKNVISF